MGVRLLTAVDDLRQYGTWVEAHPEGSLWQSLEWKAYQQSLGREVRIYAALENGEIAASALVVIDRTSFGLSTWEIPRGPLWNMEYGISNVELLLQNICGEARPGRAFSVYLSSSKKIPYSTFNIQHSGRHVMPEATRIIDLTLSEEGLLGQMKPKGRYNIGLAQKHGVRVVKSGDTDAYSALARQTWARDGFRGPKSGYGHFLKDLPGSFLLLAYHPDTAVAEPIAGLLGVVWGSTGLYYYGASSNTHRELMAPYLLQWEAMRLCRAAGCTSYDLFGIAPEGAVNHPWSGVSEFKAKFGGKVVTYPPEQEVTLRPMLKTLLSWKRRLIG